MENLPALLLWFLSEVKRRKTLSRKQIKAENTRLIGCASAVVVWVISLVFGGAIGGALRRATGGLTGWAADLWGLVLGGAIGGVLCAVIGGRALSERTDRAIISAIVFAFCGALGGALVCAFLFSV